ncbi:hypothetical protein IMSAG049_00540 [Clostridiales bacterium]|nr:hypothetical protein IMSAG049_00540 [Clostridiales bacterium]
MAEEVNEETNNELEEYYGTLENNCHSIYDGNIGGEEVRMIFTRTDDMLSAAYITRADEEKFFDAKLGKNSFVLNGEGDDLLEGGVVTDEQGFLTLKGEGMISGKAVEFTLMPNTYFQIGGDIDDYYSAAKRRTAKEAEEFAMQIKADVDDKESFIKLIEYPVQVNFRGELIFAENEVEMYDLYDKLMAYDGFHAKVKNMFTKYLFENYQGVCAENGIIWYEMNSDGNYKIIAFNA